MGKNQIIENANEEIEVGGMEILAQEEKPTQEETPIVEPEVPSQEETPVDPEIPKEDPKPVMGVVTNCIKLNVRRRPRVDPKPTSVVATLPALTDVEIDEGKSTEEFYKICTAAGIEGFCMKKFIAVKQ